MRCTEDLRWARPWSDMARPALECRNAASEQGAGVSQRDTMVQWRTQSGYYYNYSTRSVQECRKTKARERVFVFGECSYLSDFELCSLCFCSSNPFLSLPFFLLACYVFVFLFVGDVFPLCSPLIFTSFSVLSLSGCVSSLCCVSSAWFLSLLYCFCAFLLYVLSLFSLMDWEVFGSRNAFSIILPRGGRRRTRGLHLFGHSIQTNIDLMKRRRTGSIKLRS